MVQCYQSVAGNVLGHVINRRKKLAGIVVMVVGADNTAREGGTFSAAAMKAKYEDMIDYCSAG